MTQSFKELCLKHGTDKVIGRHQFHDYDLRYPIYFESIRTNPVKLLEIGVQDGCSIRMWEDYFPNACITGIDIDPKCANLDFDRSKIFIGKQEDTDFLLGVSSRRGPFDIIIDDGGHICWEQQQTFKTLFPLLSDGGIYVIEDLRTSYMKPYGGEYESNRSTIELLKHAVDVLNEEWIYENRKRRRRRTMKVRPEQFVNKYSDFPLHLIDGIHFYKEIVFVMKVNQV